MSATCFTMGLHTGIARAVSSYFTKFKVLPPRALVVAHTTTPRGPVSFETLVGAVKAATTPSVVIVVHGYEDGSGLYLPLANRGRSPHGAHTQHDKLQRLMTIAARRPAQITATDRTELSLADAEINRLIGLMRDVQAKHIDAIEFRGCNLGRNAHSVARFRAFFGASSFGAPNLHSFFGQNPVATGPGIMASHARSHQGTTFTYAQTFAGKRCLCCIGVNDHRKPQNGHVVADDEATLNAWIQANFDPKATWKRPERLPIHGLWQFPTININDPDIFANTDPRPIFPLQKNAAGHNEYRAHVVYSP